MQKRNSIILLLVFLFAVLPAFCGEIGDEKVEMVLNLNSLTDGQGNIEIGFSSTEVTVEKAPNKIKNVVLKLGEDEDYLEEGIISSFYIYWNLYTSDQMIIELNTSGPMKKRSTRMEMDYIIPYQVSWNSHLLNGTGDKVDDLVRLGGGSNGDIGMYTTPKVVVFRQKDALVGNIGSTLINFSSADLKEIPAGDYTVEFILNVKFLN